MCKVDFELIIRLICPLLEQNLIIKLVKMPIEPFQNFSEMKICRFMLNFSKCPVKGLWYGEGVQVGKEACVLQQRDGCRDGLQNSCARWKSFLLRFLLFWHQLEL